MGMSFLSFGEFIDLVFMIIKQRKLIKTTDVISMKEEHKNEEDLKLIF